MDKEDYFPWDEIQDTNVLPSGMIHFNLDELIDDVSSGGDSGLRSSSRDYSIPSYEYVSVGFCVASEVPERVFSD